MGEVLSRRRPRPSAMFRGSCSDDAPSRLGSATNVDALNVDRGCLGYMHQRKFRLASLGIGVPTLLFNRRHGVVRAADAYKTVP